MNRRGFIAALGLGAIIKPPKVHALVFHKDAFALTMKGLDMSPEAIRDREIMAGLRYLARAADRALRATARIGRKLEGGERWSEIRLADPLTSKNVRAAVRILARDADTWGVTEFRPPAIQGGKYVVRYGRAVAQYLPPVRLEDKKTGVVLHIRRLGCYSIAWHGKVRSLRNTVRSA